MAKTKPTKRSAAAGRETDGAYFLKLMLYIVLGSLWVKFQAPLVAGPIVLSGVPVGLMLGLLFATHDHFQVDRKIEYAVLVVVTAASYYLPMGIVL